MLTLVIDPPPVRSNLIVEVDPLAPTAYKRDESFFVQVRASEPLIALPTLGLYGRLLDGGFAPVTGQPAGGTCCPGAVPNCTCFRVNLASALFQQFNATMGLQAHGKDLANNSNVVGGDAGVEVTRWRWARITYGATDVPRAPAIDYGGNLVVGVASTPFSNDTGRVYSLSPLGALNWTSPGLEQVTAGLSIAGGDAGVVYVPARTTSDVSFMKYLHAGTGAAAVISATTACPNQSGAALLAAPTVNVVTVAGVATDTIFAAHDQVAGAGVNFLGHRPFDAQNGCSPTSPDVTAATLPEMSMASVGATFMNGSSAGSGGAVQQRGVVVGTVNHTNAVGYNPRTLAIVPAANAIYGTGNTGGLADGGVFLVPLNGPGVTAVYPPSFTAIGAVGGLAIGQGTQLYFGGAIGPRLHQLSGNFGQDKTFPTNGMVVGTPVIGAGDQIYAATDGGSVYAFDATLTRQWEMAPRSFPVVGIPSFEVSPTLDCGPRASSGQVNTGPGTLYLAARNTGAVYAIIVDSAGLDPGAPWPKFQRDTRNTGNADTPVISSGNCRP